MKIHERKSEPINIQLLLLRLKFHLPLSVKAYSSTLDPLASSSDLQSTKYSYKKISEFQPMRICIMLKNWFEYLNSFVLLNL